jgi:hypothetical protein
VWNSVSAVIRGTVARALLNARFIVYRQLAVVPCRKPERSGGIESEVEAGRLGSPSARRERERLSCDCRLEEALLTWSRSEREEQSQETNVDEPSCPPFLPSISNRAVSATRRHPELNQRSSEWRHHPHPTPKEGSSLRKSPNSKTTSHPNNNDRQSDLARLL